MADENDNNDIFNRLRKLQQETHKAAYGEVDDHRVGGPKYFAALQGVLKGINDEKLVSVLKHFGEHIQEMNGDEYDTGSSLKLIKLYLELSRDLDEQLTPEMQDRFRKILKKEVEFIRMEESDNDDVREMAEKAKATSHIQRAQKDDLTDQQQLVNFYLNKILDYRLSTLPDNAAWDFVAQSVLIHSKKEFIS